MLPASLRRCFLYPVPEVVVSLVVDPVVGRIELPEVDRLAIRIGSDLTEGVVPLLVRVAVAVLNLVDVDTKQALAILVASSNLVAYPLDQRQSFFPAALTHRICY